MSSGVVTVDLDSSDTNTLFHKIPVYVHIVTVSTLSDWSPDEMEKAKR